MVIAAIETSETGGNVVQLLFSLTLIFCGVLATPQVLPGFWIFMYRVSPFTYIVSAILSTGLANAKVVCSKVEYTTFDPPTAGQTCAQYLEDYIQASGGGYLREPNATSGCEFCTMSTTNQYLATVDIDYSDRWRNFGIIWAYTIFNAFAACFLYWYFRVPKTKKPTKKDTKE